MDRIQIINKIKNTILSLILDFPKTISINRESNQIVFSINYPYSEEYKKFYNEGYLSDCGRVLIKLDGKDEDLKYNIADLLKAKRFLKNRNNKSS